MGLTLDGFPEPGDRFLLASLALQGHGQFVLDAGQLRVELDGQFQVGRSGLVLAGGLKRAAILRLGEGVGGLQLDRGFEHGAGCGVVV